MLLQTPMSLTVYLKSVDLKHIFQSNFHRCATYGYYELVQLENDILERYAVCVVIQQNEYHIENLSMQYTAIFNGSKMNFFR